MLIKSFIVVDQNCYRTPSQTPETLHICAVSSNRRTPSLRLRRSTFQRSAVDRAVDTTELIPPSDTLRKKYFFITCPLRIPTPRPYPLSSQTRVRRSQNSADIQQIHRDQQLLTDPPHDPGERHLRDVLHAFSQYNATTSLSSGNFEHTQLPKQSFPPQSH
jgi:hypothetical protein